MPIKGDKFLDKANGILCMCLISIADISFLDPAVKNIPFIPSADELP
jgi:hypothetical protein